jgi:hypothetical protein
MGDFYFAGQVAQLFGRRPQDVTQAIYHNGSLAAECPVVNGRRLIPRRLMPEIEQALKSRRGVQAVAACG